MGLVRVTVGTEFNTFGPALFRRIAGDHYDARRGTAFFDSSQDFDATDRSHLDIENSEGEVYAIDIGEGLAAIERRGDAIAFFGKKSIYYYQEIGFIVHEEKRRLHDALIRIMGIHCALGVVALYYTIEMGRKLLVTFILSASAGKTPGRDAKNTSPLACKWNQQRPT